jgi:hypothetical protein
VADASDLRTETFSNARGWIAVRVTHRPSSIVVERSRTNALRSAVQAQRECIEEIKLLLDRGESRPDHDPTPSPEPPAPTKAPITRSEFDRLAERVANLERRLGDVEPAP